MVARTFFAIDNDSLIVTSSSSGGLVGNGITNNSTTPTGTIYEYSSGGGALITLEDTGGSLDTFEDDNSASHVITDGAGIVANGTNVESESMIVVRALDQAGNQTGPNITIYVFSQNSNFNDVWGFASDQPLVNGTSYVNVSGTNAGSSLYSNFVACFAPGTLIDTADAQIAVEDIETGQLIWTRDNGPLPVRWVATTEVDGDGAFAPIVFEPGAIDNKTQLSLSPQHRVAIKSAAVELLFGEPEVLIAAKYLCGLPGVSISPQSRIRYTHFMFDSHQIVRSNGALTESFFLAEQPLNSLSHGPRAELLALFPELASGYDAFGATAAMTLDSRQAAALRSCMI